MIIDSRIEWLCRNMREVFLLPEEAIAWMIKLWNITQVFDDMADGDKPERENINSALWDSLVGMNQSEFFLKNSAILSVSLASLILKWQSSDAAERCGAACEMSFAWRAAYYDVLLIVIQICHGTEFAVNHAKNVMMMYGEKYEDYKKEFPNA